MPTRLLLSTNSIALLFSLLVFSSRAPPSRSLVDPVLGAEASGRASSLDTLSRKRKRGDRADKNEEHFESDESSFFS